MNKDEYEKQLEKKEIEAFKNGLYVGIMWSTIIINIAVTIINII